MKFPMEGHKIQVPNHQPDIYIMVTKWDTSNISLLYYFPFPHIIAIDYI